MELVSGGIKSVSTATGTFRVVEKCGRLFGSKQLFILLSGLVKSKKFQFMGLFPEFCEFFLKCPENI
jgi:hypothetical protein